jgi:hypothetical protein
MKSKYILFVLLMIIIGAVTAGIYSYMHNCKQEMREVDRYALPKAIEFMEAIDGWNYQAIKPLLSNNYINSLSAEEWKSEIEQLAVLGELKSFARPHFVSHQAYKRYKICESAIDSYSIASEFEKDNAVIRIFFENNCGKLKVISFLVTSRSIVVKPEYLEDNKNDREMKKSIEELTNDDIEGDLDLMYEESQEDTSLPELDEAASKKVQKKLEESKGKSHGKVYR